MTHLNQRFVPVSKTSQTADWFIDILLVSFNLFCFLFFVCVCLHCVYLSVHELCVSVLRYMYVCYYEQFKLGC